MIDFNLTASYRHDADLVVPYGKIYRRPVALHDDDQRVLVEMKHKSKMIAWFVSDCWTNSEREKYVDKLNKSIAVDIYGSCKGALRCEPSQSTKCYHMVQRLYYFYLSFENSLCE